MTRCEELVDKNFRNVQIWKGVNVWVVIIRCHLSINGNAVFKDI